MDKVLLTQIWQDCLKQLEKTLDKTAFEAWIAPLILQMEQSLQTEELVLEAPDPFFKDWVIKNYFSTIQDILRKRLSLEQLAFGIKILPKNDRSVKVATIQDSRGYQLNKKREDFILNPRFTFENFVVGPCNRFAYAASMAVAESPSRAYNPLFIYGGVGLGKTHLMQAVCHYVRSKNQSINICYLPSERFTNELIDAIQHRSTSLFRQKYRNMDILVVDDIHFIAGKESTQEEFFNTFNTLYDAHKQIVICSDRSPREIPRLEERLVSRFSWGLITDVQPPGFETRVAILKKKIEREPVDISDEVMFFIAQVIRTNIRELEGALVRVTARSLLEEKPITIALTKEVLKDYLKQDTKPIDFQKILEYVAEEFGVSLSELKTKHRSKNIVLPRQVAMYVSRQLTDASLPEIAKFFGGRDHTTILYACKKIKFAQEKNKDLKQKIERVIQYFKH